MLTPRPTSRAASFALLGATIVATVSTVLILPATAANKVDLSKVQKATSEAPTMSFAMTLDMAMPVGAKSVNARIAATGKADKPNKASQIDMDMGGLMKAVSGEQALPYAAEDLKMSMIVIDSKMYMKFGLLNVLSGGANTKPWTMVDTKSLGVDSGDVLASQGADPTQGLDFLSGLGANAKEVGSEKVRGVDTTRVDTTVDLAILMKNTPPDQQAQARVMFGNKTALPVSIWVDGQNRARKFDITFELTQQGKTIPAKTSYEFFGFGEKVSISAPPASQVGPNAALESMIRQAATAKKTPKKAA